MNPATSYKWNHMIVVLLFLLPWSRIFPSSMHIPECVRSFTICKVETYSSICIYHILFIYLSMHGHRALIFSQVFSVKNASVNISMQIPLWVPPFNSCKYITRKEMYGFFFFFNLKNKVHLFEKQEGERDWLSSNLQVHLPNSQNSLGLGPAEARSTELHRLLL